MKEQHDSRAEILSELERLEESIRKNDFLFDMAEDGDLIEAAIYEKRALQARYAFLIKTAKENGVKLDFTDRL